ncbi:amidohydrolase family protein [Candidatus Rariloculus sp.]|uniref:amidohydrolase family protein n=1 Tax=Candidatus Rariloculus sp. TaxID=3101265 RepID=UPI003D1405CB
MQGKIAFEEHFAVEETLEQTRGFAGDSGHWDDFTRQILDLEEERLEQMDETGIELAILSLNAPGVQRILDPDEAMAVARKANDRMAEAVSKHPARYAALAALPMHDPVSASWELGRCVRELGFKGCMVNGFQQVGDAENVRYYDLPEYDSFWAAVSELDVPFYLHPRMQIPSRAQNYEGHPWLMSAPWGFAVETSIHALRLCGSGMFDDYPNLRICLGHLGENIPFGLWRIDARMRFSRRGYRGNKPLGAYFREHFHLTTSGNFNNAAFRCTLEMIDHDKVYFSADYPFEKMEDAADWYDSTDVISEDQRRKFGRSNAITLFDLDLK